MTSSLNETHADDYPMFVHIDSPLVDQDAPTVADYATAPFSLSDASGNQFSYGVLWRAYAHDTGSYPEM